ncbi:TonB-dependent receptor [Endozoicomonas gorgoniicola]|uniref:TonB-dependent receptor n=1 Tax=Endozoicomonas gorgoniicola TaxID=1234144 RepID=A0ABT3N0L1_9GAMM|nr:TonB-dependent receptor [Endozoicomonas gorgoniicola]MCW7555154.1 TonB-dependent receptor [Endozoicomonas gorgoniicola]
MNNKTPLALAIALCGSTAIAEESNVTRLDDVVVTASRVEENISSIAGTVQVIDKTAIEQQSVAGQKLADVLAVLVPGFGPSTRAATDRSQTIRGRKVLLLIDGVAQTESRQASRQMNTVRPENIERIEVVSGASAIYGSGAAGGIINIITKKPDTDDARFSTTVGITMPANKLDSDGLTWRINQGVSGRKGNFDYLASATFEQRAGFFDSDGDRISPGGAQLGRGDTETRDLLLKLGYDLNETQRLEADLQVFRDDMDSDYGLYYGENLSYAAPFGAPVITEGVNKAVKGLTLDDQPYSHRNSYSLSFIDEDFLGHRATVQGYYRDREYRFFPFAYDLKLYKSFLKLPDSTMVVNQSTSEARVHGLKLTMDKNLNKRFRLVYGLDYKKDKGKQTGTGYDANAFTGSNGLNYQPTGTDYEYGPDVETTTLGGFVQARFNITDRLTMNTGYRHERVDVDIADYRPVLESWILPLKGSSNYTTFKGGKKDYTADLFNLGLVFQLSDKQETFINYSEGFEVPDPARLLRNVLPAGSALSKAFGATSLDKVNLDATKIKNYELGWRGRFDALTASVTAFYNESDQIIKFTKGYGVQILDQDKKIYGIESALSYYINDDWQVGGSYTFTEGRTYNEDLKKWLDLSAVDVSPQKLTAFVSYEQEDYMVRLQALNFADYDKGYDSEDNPGKETFDGYTVFDLTASFWLPVGRLDASVNNLLNEDYQTVYSQWARKTYGVISAMPAQGRTVSLSYSIEY